MKTRMTWSTGAVSEQGRRSENQDRMTRFASSFGEVVVVADGMGGMQGGAEAASTVVRMLPELLRETPATTAPAQALRDALAVINTEIYERGHSGDESVAHMGSTVVLALLREDGEALVANIGDSRAYLYRDGKLRQLTRDHSAVQRMVDAGMITEEEARRHPESSVLTRALGQQKSVELEVYPVIALRPGDGLLLCSDGLSGYASHSSISQALERVPDAAGTARILNELAFGAGSDDNITIQYLRVHGVPVTPTAPPPRATWKRWAPAVALALLACFGGYRVWHSRVEARRLALPIDNRTGQTAPPGRDTVPEKPEAPQPAKPRAVVYAGPSEGNWIERAGRSGCAEVQRRERAEWKGTGGGAEPMILYRKEAAVARDCLLRAVPDLARAKSKMTKNLPKGIDVVVLTALPETAEL